ncbi:hypothetical protein BDN67DRAFT_1016747 [Paxillus ammoniavirescens]|nr:hypothetical protein BDN67DRAFT_1016747 [Paxillus ammoniavirescens]
MSAIIALQTLLDQSASIIEGTLRDLEWESEADCATAQTWTHINNLIYEEMVMVQSRLENAPAGDPVVASPPGATWNNRRHLCPPLVLAAPAGNRRDLAHRGHQTAWPIHCGRPSNGAREDMAVEKSKGKGKGKGKEVVEATVEKGILKNKGKGRESSKDMGQVRGRSKSTATSRYKSAEVVSMDSEDEGTGLPPKGPLPTPSSVQDTPWPTCDYCAIKGLMCGPGPGAGCCHCKRRKTKCLQSATQKARAKSTKRGRSVSSPPAKSTASRQQSQAPPPLKKSQSGELHTMAGPSRPRQERFDGVVIPLPSRSFARSSIPPARQSMQPDDGLSPLPVSKDKEIATLQVQVWILEQKVADWMCNTQALTTVVEALRRQGPHHQHPLAPYPFDLASYIGDTNSPSSPAPRDSTAITDGYHSTTSCHNTAKSPRSSAPPITVLSPATTPSSGPDIMTTPEVDTQQPSPAAVTAAQPDINMPVDVGPAPSALGPMEDVQVSPNITIIDIDAVVDVDAAPILVADGMVTAAEAEGDPDPPTTPALPSPQQPAAALQALTAMYEDEEDMEVDD